MLKTRLVHGSRPAFEQIYILYDYNYNFESFLLTYKETMYTMDFILIEEDYDETGRYVVPKRVDGQVVLKDIRNINRLVDLDYDKYTFCRVQMLDGFPLIKFDRLTMESNPETYRIWDGFPVRLN